MSPNSFYEQVYAVTRLIPKGMVMSYGGVARQLGRPGLARTVGYALHNLPANTDVPWWRVVNTHGRISNSYSPETQAERLRAEGVAVDKNLRLNMRRHDAERIVYHKLHRRMHAQRRRRSVARG